MKIFKIIILFLFISNSVYSNEIEKFNKLIDDISLKKVDWYIFGFDIKNLKKNNSLKVEDTYRGYFNEKSKNMRKTPVYTGEIFFGEKNNFPTKLSAHFSNMKKFFDYEDTPTKAFRVPIKNMSKLNQGFLPVPLLPGWVAQYGEYSMYINTKEKVKEMFELVHFIYNESDYHKLRNLCYVEVEIGNYIINVDRPDILFVGGSSFKSNKPWNSEYVEKIFDCILNEMKISEHDHKLDESFSKNKTQKIENTTSSITNLNTNLNNWKIINRDDKLTLIENYFLQVLKVEAQTTEEKTSLIDMSNNIIKCVDSLNLNISIGKAIGQCL